MVVVRTRSSCTSHGSEVEYSLRLPSIVDPLYWKKHQLTENDISQITNMVPSWYLWTSAMLFGKICSWSSIRLAFSDPYSTIINSKKNAIEYMLQATNYTPTVAPDRIQLDSHTQYKHTPPLPMYVIPADMFSRLKQNIVPVLLPVQFGTEPVQVPYIETLLGNQWVPYRIEGPYISLIAIGSSDPDDLYQDAQQPLSRQLMRCSIKGVEYILSDELIWVKCKE